MSQEIINQLIQHYKDDPAVGVSYATNQLYDLLPRIDEDRVIFSNIEGNIFKWQEVGRTAADWFAIWSKVKKGLQDCLDSVSPARGIFTPTFCNIEH